VARSRRREQEGRRCSRDKGEASGDKDGSAAQFLGRRQPTATRSRDGRETEIPGGGQSADVVAEREVKVLACEQSINGSPDKHKGVVRATRVSCSRETGCSAAKWGDMTTRTRVSTLACSLSLARVCERVHSFG
jgi:hypothetical protein